MEFAADDHAALFHYGILQRSGRYPWGSGGNVADRSKSFLDWFKDLLGQGLSEQQAAEGVGMTTTQIRETRTIARAEKKAADVGLAQRLKDKDYSNIAIGQRMGIPESSVRNLLKPGAADTAKIIRTTTDVLRDNVDKKTYIDVGKGVEVGLGISKEKLGTATAILKDEGYGLYTLKEPQLGTGKDTQYKILTKPGITQKEAWLNRGKIEQWGIDNYSDDGGRTAYGIKPPMSLSQEQVAIKYAEDGGTEADGTMYVRPGVDAVSIGANQYAQVRVKVGDSHYIKGMAVYKEDLPVGVDIMFNTNKSDTGNKLDALKELSDDPDNPFGAVIKRQLQTRDADTGKETLTSAMNILSEEGDWDDWSRTLSSQMLSKQNPKLAQQQLDLYHERKQNELDEIMELTNPVVKRVLLNQFSDSADSAAVHLKAAGLPGQSTHVLLPVAKLRPTEVYAPNFENGDRVVLVRYPHGGVFEVPELTVNNRNRAAKNLLGQAKDAIGINSKVAEQLSGADFDGDTVLVIPNGKGQIKTAPVLKQLKDFDPKASYPKYDGMRTMKNTQTEMGLISNLVTDMTIMGAKQEEIARAVRHSMVVIDAEKHSLNYKQSAKDNGIKELRRKYLGGGNKGASTLISKAKGQRRVPDYEERKASEGGSIDPKTGKKVYVQTGKRNKDGSLKLRKVQRLEYEDDAYNLISTPGTPIERVYAKHSNRMKAMANTSRKEMLSTRNIPYDPQARRVYKRQVDALDAKYKTALRNKPRERQAQILANNTLRIKKQADPTLATDSDRLKKAKSQSLAQARVRTSAHKAHIKIIPAEWRAIQAGAVSNNRLKEIVSNADIDDLKKLATPRTKLLMNSSKRNRARGMLNSGYTQAEVANALGVSLTTLKDDLRG